MVICMGWINYELFIHVFIILDPTDPPGKPVVVDSDKNFIKIQWDKPKRDGGAPVLSYNVERKDPRTGVWTKINDDPIKVIFLIPRQAISVLLEYYRESFYMLYDAYKLSNWNVSSLVKLRLCVAKLSW